MEQIRVPAGTAQKFEDVFKRVQDAIKINLDKRFANLFKKFGVILLTKNLSPSDTDWRPEVVDIDSRTIRINVGSDNKAYGLTQGKDVLELHGAIETTLSAGPSNTDGDYVYHVIFIQQQELYSDPVPVIDGFLYDENGDVSQAMTSIKDQWIIKKVMYNTWAEAEAASINYYDNRAALAIVRVERVNGVWIIQNTWTEGTVSVTEALNSVYDIRSLNTLQLNDDLLDDTKLFFKDRDSTDATANPILGKATFKERVHIDDDVTLSNGQGLGLGFTETESLGSGVQVHIKGDSLNGVLKLEQETANFSSKLYLKNTVNEWGIQSDSTPNELRLGRVTTLGQNSSSLYSDISWDSSGNTTIGENLTVTKTSTFTDDAAFLADVTIQKGLGVGFSSGEDVLDNWIMTKTDDGDAGLALTTTDTTGHAKITLSTSHATDFNLAATDSGTLVLGRVIANVEQTDLLIDTAGQVLLLNDFSVSGDSMLSGNLTVDQNLLIDSGNGRVFLGKNISSGTLAALATDLSEVVVASKDGNLKTNLHILTERTDNNTVGLNIETDASLNLTTFYPDIDGIIAFANQNGVNTSNPALLTIDTANSWVGAQTLDLGKDATTNATALYLNNANSIELNAGSSSKTYISQYADDKFGIASNLQFDGSGLNLAQLNGSHGHAFINLETNTNSGIIQFGVGAPGTAVTSADHVLTIVQNQSFSEVIIHDSTDLVIGDNRFTSDQSTSNIAQAVGSRLTYQTGLIDMVTSETVATEQLLAGALVVNSGASYVGINGQLEIIGDNNISFINLTNTTVGAALLYDNQNNNIQLNDTADLISGTLAFGETYWTAHKSAGYPQVDFTGLTAVSGTIGALTLTENLDVPSIIAGDIYGSTAELTTLQTENLSSESTYLNTSVTFNEAAITIGSGTTFQQTVHGDNRDTYMVTASGTGYFIGAGVLGSAASNYPGIEIQEAFPTPTTPTNFRIWDAYPTNNKNEIAGYIHLKWNYSDLAVASMVVGQNTVEIVADTVNSTGEVFNETDANKIIGKTIVLYPHLNKYQIAAYDTSTRVVTLEAGQTWTTEDVNTTTHAAIVDSNITGYILKIIQMNWTGAAWIETSFQQAIPLDDDFITLPGYVTKLELGKTWKFKLKAVNAESSSAYTVLSNGSYDPNHDFNSADSVSYNADFQFTLPDIEATAGISLDASPLGFNINLTGDAWKDSNDAQNNSHEYEIIYSETSNPSFSNYSNVFHIFTENTLVPISANTPAHWYVKARPIQNKQPVGSGLSADVVGGGGGIPPGEQMIVQMPVSVIVTSGTVASVSTATNPVGDTDNIITIGSAYDEYQDEISIANGAFTGVGLNFYNDFDLNTDLGAGLIQSNSSFFSWT